MMRCAKAGALPECVTCPHGNDHEWTIHCKGDNCQTGAQPIYEEGTGKLLYVRGFMARCEEVKE